MDDFAHEEAVIGDVRYLTTPLPFDDALALKLELASLVSGPLSEALGGALKDDASIMDLDLGQLAPALGKLPDMIIRAGGPALVARCLAKTQVVIGGKRRMLSDPSVRTEAWSGGKWKDFYRVLWWVLKVNFGPFLMAAIQLFGIELSELLAEPEPISDPS